MSAAATLQADIRGRERLIAASRRLIGRWRVALAHLRQPFTMYDAVDVTVIPRRAGAVAGYVGGQWPTFGRLGVLFPKAWRLSIAVTAGEPAECLDIETGDATPEQAPAWVRAQHARGVRRPVLYANLSTMPAVVGAIRASGIKRGEVRLWVADWTGRPHIPAGYDACQWQSTPALDLSLCAGSFRVS